jgi:hypothetical protein
VYRNSNRKIGKLARRFTYGTLKDLNFLRIDFLKECLGLHGFIGTTHRNSITENTGIMNKDTPICGGAWLFVGLLVYLWGYLS